MSLSSAVVKQLLSISNCSNVHDLEIQLNNYCILQEITNNNSDQLEKFPYRISNAYLSYIKSSSFLAETKYKIDWSKLCQSTIPFSLYLLEKNPDKINWGLLSSNPSLDAIYLLEKNFDKIDWFYLSSNSSSWAINILKKNPQRINWLKFSINTSLEAIDLIEKKIDEENKLTSAELEKNLLQNKINWNALSLNENAIKLLEKNQNKIIWSLLSANPSAIKLLEQNFDKIIPLGLCKNPNIEAIDLLEKLVKIHGYSIIDWESLYNNQNALYFIKRIFNDSNSSLIKLPSSFFYGNDLNNYQNLLINFDKYKSSKMPNMFELNKDYLKARLKYIQEELCSKVFHPKNEGKLWSFEDEY